MAFKMKYKKDGFPFKIDKDKDKEGRQHKVTYDARSEEFKEREEKRKKLLGLA